MNPPINRDDLKQVMSDLNYPGPNKQTVPGRPEYQISMTLNDYGYDYCPTSMSDCYAPTLMFTYERFSYQYPQEEQFFKDLSDLDLLRWYDHVDAQTVRDNWEAFLSQAEMDKHDTLNDLYHSTNDPVDIPELLFSYVIDATAQLNAEEIMVFLDWFYSVILGWPTNTWTSNGYSQGDSVTALTVITPDYLKLTGCDDSHTEDNFKCVEYDFGSWLWGDVYYIDITAPGYEQDCVYYVYGRDTEYNGAIDIAIELIAEVDSMYAEQDALPGYRQGFIIICEDGRVYQSTVKAEDPKTAETAAVMELPDNSAVWSIAPYPIDVDRRYPPLGIELLKRADAA